MAYERPPENTTHYEPVLSKRQRVGVRKNIQLVEEKTPNEWEEHGIGKTAYRVFLDTGGGEIAPVVDGQPIKVYIADAKALRKLPDGHFLRGPLKAIEEELGEELDPEHKIAHIDEFFWHGRGGKSQVLPHELQGMGIGAGSFDLLLKALSEKGVHFVSMSPSGKSQELAKKRGFRDYGKRQKTYAIDRYGLIERLQKMDEEER